MAHLGVVAADGTTQLLDVGGCAAQQQTLEAAGIRAEWQHTELGYCPGQRMRHAETCGMEKWPCCARASDCSVLMEESVVLACRYWLRRYTQVRR